MENNKDVLLLSYEEINENHFKEYSLNQPEFYLLFLWCNENNCKSSKNYLKMVINICKKIYEWKNRFYYPDFEIIEFIYEKIKIIIEEYSKNNASYLIEKSNNYNFDEWCRLHIDDNDKTFKKQLWAKWEKTKLDKYEIKTMYEMLIIMAFNSVDFDKLIDNLQYHYDEIINYENKKSFWSCVDKNDFSQNQ